MTRDDLGGRLPLLRTDELDDAQATVHAQLQTLVGPEARRDGYVAQLDDGRFIGPFNAMLRVPELTTGFGGWVRAIGAAAIPDDVRQVVILTVGVAWRAEYEISAHVSAARRAGIADEVISDLLAGERPTRLRRSASLAHDLTRAIVRDHDVPDELYADCVGEFDVGGTIALLSLIGQYQLVSSLLVCFSVPSVSS